MNSKKCAKVLIEAKCNIDSVDNSGSTPLHYAASTNNLEMIPLLLDNGASVNIMDKDGLTAIELAAEGKSTAAYAVTILLLRFYHQNNLPLPKQVKKNLNRFLSQPNQTLTVAYAPNPSHGNTSAVPAANATGPLATVPVSQTPLPAHLSAAYSQALREAAQARVHSDSEDPSSSPKKRKGKKAAHSTHESTSGHASSTPTVTRSAGAMGGKESTLAPIQISPTTNTLSSASRSPGSPAAVLSIVHPSAVTPSAGLTMELGLAPAAANAGGAADDLEMYHHNSMKTIAETLFPPTPFPPLLLSKASGSKYLDVVVAVEHCVDCETHNKLSLRHDSAQYTKVANEVLFGVIKSVIEQKFAIRLFAYRTKSTKYEGKLGGMEVTIAVNLTPQLTDEQQQLINKNTASNKIQSRNKHASLDFSANQPHLKVNRKMSNMSGIDHNQSGQSLLDLKDEQLQAMSPTPIAQQDKDYQN